METNHNPETSSSYNYLKEMLNSVEEIDRAFAVLSIRHLALNEPGEAVPFIPILVSLLDDPVICIRRYVIWALHAISINNSKELYYAASWRRLFSWDKVPGSDNGRLLEFLNQRFGMEWIKGAKIEKIDNGRTIIISTEKNSLSLRLDDEKTKVSLKVDNVRNEVFAVKTENSELNIYSSSIIFKLCKDPDESVKNAALATEVNIVKYLLDSGDC